MSGARLPALLFSFATLPRMLIFLLTI